MRDSCGHAGCAIHVDTRVRETCGSAAVRVASGCGAARAASGCAAVRVASGCVAVRVASGCVAVRVGHGTVGHSESAPRDGRVGTGRGRSFSVLRSTLPEQRSRRPGRAWRRPNRRCVGNAADRFLAVHGMANRACRVTMPQLRTFHSSMSRFPMRRSVAWATFSGDRDRDLRPFVLSTIQSGIPAMALRPPAVTAAAHAPVESTRTGSGQHVLLGHRRSGRDLTARSRWSTPLRLRCARARRGFRGRP
jgi:hypothetical protein